MFSRKKKDTGSQKGKELTAEERTEFRDNENTKAMFSRCEELTTEMLSDEDRLDKGDFVIARVIWNVKTDEKTKDESSDEEKPSNEEKYHDHWAIVNERKDDGLDVLLVTDVTKHGEKATTFFWEFSILEKHMKEGKLNLLRFNLLDIQDPDEMVLERAKNYVHNAGKHRAMQFAYQSIFGNKEPVYSDYHLSLCEPKTLLMLRSDSQQKVLLLKHVQKDGDGWNFEITKQDEPDDRTHVLTYHEILDLIEGDDDSLFYFPGVEIESLEALMEAQSEAQEALSASKAVHATGETLAIHAAEHALEHALVKTVGHQALVTTAVETAGGIVLHGVVATGIASHQTVKHRRKEKLFKKTGGLSGFSRTKANREVTKAWSEAVVGTGSSVGGTFGGAAIGTMILPGVGTLVGGLVGGIASGLAGGAIGNIAAGKVYDMNLRRKCEFC